ncbi:lysis system i-spanin subunit Rz, partial [Morganella morganii]
AKTEIDRLRIAADRNPERVYIKASCPKTGSVTATGMDDAATARPDDAAVRNYWLLRERIAESKQMILGLQEYINTQCLAK